MDQNDIRNNYMHYDMDWFIKDTSSNKYIHVASGGGVLPEVILETINDEHGDSKYERDLRRIRKIPIPQQEKISLEALYAYCNNNNNFVSINTDYYERILKNTPEKRERYFASFVLMALKGFYSFDKSNINDSDDTYYHLVAWPTEQSQNEMKGIGDIPEFDFKGALSHMADKGYRLLQYPLVDILNQTTPEI